LTLTASQSDERPLNRKQVKVELDDAGNDEQDAR
jgi:hypothetical protein